MNTAPTATAQPAAPFALIDSKWQSHLKFAGRAPRTLTELAVARCDAAHRARMIAIKAMAAKLALLDQFAEPLFRLGVSIADRDVHTTDGGKVLRLYPLHFKLTDDDLHLALSTLGFREVLRRSGAGCCDLVNMKHGRALVLAIDVSKLNA